MPVSTLVMIWGVLGLGMWLSALRLLEGWYDIVASVLWVAREASFWTLLCGVA